MSIESIFLVADCCTAIYQHHFDLSLNKLLAKQKEESLYARVGFDDSKNPIWRRCFPYVPQYHQSSLTSASIKDKVCVCVFYDYLPNFLVHFQIMEKNQRYKLHLDVTVSSFETKISNILGTYYSTWYIL